MSGSPSASVEELASNAQTCSSHAELKSARGAALGGATGRPGLTTTENMADRSTGFLVVARRPAARPAARALPESPTAMLTRPLPGVERTARDATPDGSFKRGFFVDVALHMFTSQEPLSRRETAGAVRLRRLALDPPTLDVVTVAPVPVVRYATTAITVLAALRVRTATRRPASAAVAWRVHARAWRPLPFRASIWVHPAGLPTAFLVAADRKRTSRSPARTRVGMTATCDFPPELDEPTPTCVSRGAAASEGGAKTTIRTAPVIRARAAMIDTSLLRRATGLGVVHEKSPFMLAL